MTAVATAPMTAEEFARRPRPADGSREELVRGEVETVSQPKPLHGHVQSRFDRKLGTYVEENGLGWVIVESGVVTERGPDTVRGPDVAYYSLAKYPDLPDDYFSLPPDIAVEVLSPNVRRSRVRVKIREYIAAGVRLVWLADPEAETVTVYRGDQRGVEYDATDTLDGGDVLPGFAVKVAYFFARPGAGS